MIITMKTTGKVIAIVLLVLVIAIELYFVASGIQKLSPESESIARQPGYTSAIPEQLAWRKLCPVEGVNCDADPDHPGHIAMMYIGNFDQDPEDELCLPRAGGLVFFELNEGSWEVNANGIEDRLVKTIRCITWDMDRDGTDELVPGGLPMNIPNDFDEYPKLLEHAEAAVVGYEFASVYPVVGADGEVAGLIPGDFSSDLPATGDFDGDGFSELLVSTPGNVSAMTAFGLDGEAVWKQKFGVNRMISPFSCIADFDNDGRDEWYQKLRDSWCYGMDQAPCEMASINNPSFYVGCNIDNQGIAEVITSEWIFFADSGAGRRLKYAGEPVRFGYITCGDFLTGGFLEVAVVKSVLDEQGMLYIFSSEGELLYQEVFGEAIYAIGTAQGVNADHLVVNTSSRLMVYP